MTDVYAGDDFRPETPPPEADAPPARGRALALALAFGVGLAACGEAETSARTDDPAPATRPAPVPSARPPACALDGAPTRLAGRSPALAVGALVVRRAEQSVLVRLEGAPPFPEHPLDAARVPPGGLVAREDGGWIAAAATADGPAALRIDADGAIADRIPLAVGRALRDAAVTSGADTAWIAWRDGEDTLRVAVLDLLAERLTDTHRLDDAPPGPVRLATDGRRLHVAVAGTDAPVWTLSRDGATATSIPGVLHDLTVAGDAFVVLHGAPDRTGLWLAAPSGADARRVTHPRARPRRGRLAGPPDAAVLLYRSRGDLWVQRLGVEGTHGEPRVVGAAGGAATLVARDDRFWVAWDDGDGEVTVRSGVCAR